MVLKANDCTLGWRQGKLKTKGPFLNPAAFGGKVGNALGFVRKQGAIWSADGQVDVPGKLDLMHPFDSARDDKRLPVLVGLGRADRNRFHGRKHNRISRWRIIQGDPISCRRFCLRH